MLHSWHLEPLLQGGLTGHWWKGKDGGCSNNPPRQQDHALTTNNETFAQNQKTLNHIHKDYAESSQLILLPLFLLLLLLRLELRPLRILIPHPLLRIAGLIRLHQGLSIPPPRHIIFRLRRCVTGRR